ncbi:hypothetical protein [Roseovarius sp. MMSF_3281]|nr:hypothetical protein [Roseovarius sp. MMSF_3281]
MSDNPIRLAILVGSNREGRFAPVIARWFAEQLQSTPIPRWTSSTWQKSH